MNNSRIILFLIILITSFLSNVNAGGSSYSRYGFGDILRNGDSRTYAMSGTGIALIDDGFINGLNPAGLARISLTRFSTGFEYNNFLSKDETGSSFYSTGGLQGLSFAFPISKENGVVMSAEFTPYSKVSYGITSSFFNTVTQSLQDNTIYGSGGLSYIGLGFSASPFNTLHIGTRLNYMHGRTRQYQTTSFNKVNFAPINFDRTSYYSGFTFTVGTIYEGLSTLLDVPSLSSLTVGLTLTTASSLDAELRQTFPESSYSSGDSIIIKNGTAELPLSLGFGLSYLHQNRYRFLGDLVTENWGDIKYSGLYSSNMKNSLRASIGFEALPVKSADSFLKRIVYRAGLAYNSTYYKIKGIGINEFLVSGGIGLPIGPESQLNIGLQIGTRGTTDNSLQKDTIIHLSVSVSASEIWFLRFDEE